MQFCSKTIAHCRLVGNHIYVLRNYKQTSFLAQCKITKEIPCRLKVVSVPEQPGDLLVHVFLSFFLFSSGVDHSMSLGHNQLQRITIFHKVENEKILTLCYPSWCTFYEAGIHDSTTKPSMIIHEQKLTPPLSRFKLIRRTQSITVRRTQSSFYPVFIIFSL